MVTESIKKLGRSIYQEEQKEINEEEIYHLQMVVRLMPCFSLKLAVTAALLQVNPYDAI